MTGLGCFKQTKNVDRYILGSNHELKCEQIVNGTMNQSYEIIAQQWMCIRDTMERLCEGSYFSNIKKSWYVQVVCFCLTMIKCMCDIEIYEYTFKCQNYPRVFKN